MRQSIHVGISLLYQGLGPLEIQTCCGHIENSEVNSSLTSGGSDAGAVMDWFVSWLIGIETPALAVISGHFWLEPLFYSGFMK